MTDTKKKEKTETKAEKAPPKKAAKVSFNPSVALTILLDCCRCRLSRCGGHALCREGGEVDHPHSRQSSNLSSFTINVSSFDVRANCMDSKRGARTSRRLSHELANDVVAVRAKEYSEECLSARVLYDRKKLETICSYENISGRGYSFVLPVRYRSNQMTRLFA
mmetsp:Transcript_40833/g.74761  ORF Transcript_40833/g.74761 Transcript_40833/m.74761 type:complete len:164 (-) Transcript_40833:494-985(-)